MEAGAGFTTGAAFEAGTVFDAGVVLLSMVAAGFLAVCFVVTFFTGFLETTSGDFTVEVLFDSTAGVFDFVDAAGGFWAANMVVVAIAKAIVSMVFFMAFFLPGEPFCSLALQFL